eukprot:1868616-Prymnesium_polylepis.1
MRAHGPPVQSFGAPPVKIGHVAGSRAELCVLGLHRHIFSEACYTALGMESLVLQPEQAVASARDGAAAHAGHTDLGERVLFRATEARHLALTALGVNAERQQPVRLVRAVREPRGGAPSSATRQGHGRVLQYRYDGLYLVLPHSDAQATSGGAAAPGG